MIPAILKEKYLIALLILILCNQLVAAQSGVISGRILGNYGQEAPVVNLLAVKDSSIVKAAICDTNGKFEFDRIKEGAYITITTYTGYQNHISDLINIGNDKWTILLPDIRLQQDVQGLKEVEVVNRKPFVQRKIDRVVVNPDALIGNAGATGLEVLEKAPGVMVDIDGNISLKGKQGVIIFIDNKPTYMAASEVAGYLRSIPSSTIESIELMTNPPAGYDAAGNAGIINIKLKRNKTKGLNGGINLSYGQGRYLRTNNSLNFNYRINKVNIFSNIGWNENNSYQDLTINRYYYNTDGSNKSTFAQNSYIKREHGGRTARIGFDYYLDNKSTIGAVFSGFINPSHSSTTNNARILDADAVPMTLVSAYNDDSRKWTSGSVNLNYTLKIDDKGRELSINTDYIDYKSDMDQSLLNSTFTPDHTPTGETLLESELPATIDIKTAKADYIHPLKNGSKVEAGAKTSFVNTDNIASFFDVVNTISTPNYEFSNQFKYKENINAGYLNYSKDWIKWSVQLGLRMENTNIDGYQVGNIMVRDSAFTRNYTSLFPTMYVAYRADTMQRHQFGFSFGRRINRPDYQDLNPFTYPMDRYTYYGGNPFLKPTFSYNFELSHTYKELLTTTLEYSITDDLIQETNEQRGTIYYSRPGNFGRQIVYGATMNGTIPLTKWWTLLFYAEFKNIGYQAVLYGQKLDESKWYAYIGPTNQFAITKNLSAELAGSYQTRILVGQFLTIPVWQLRAGISQKILKGNGSLRLNVSDLFYTNQPGGDIRNIADSKANWLSYLDTRVATISFSYRFNKGKSLTARESGASDTEKGRVRTN